MPIREPKTDPWSARRRLNREDPAKEKREEGTAREEESKEDVVS